jgi:aspartate dehydrogenase
MRHILLIGLGAIGSTVARALRKEAKRVRLSVLVRPGSAAGARAVKDGVAPEEVVDSLAKLREIPELAIECAGHAAVAEYGEACLTSGMDFLVTSVGSLTDAALLQRLERASRMHIGKLMIPAGAIAGVDALAAHGSAGSIGSLHLAQAPQAWRGTHAEKLCDLDAIDGPIEFYRERAGDAARLFPQNANVAATIALRASGSKRPSVRSMPTPRRRATCISSRPKAVRSAAHRGGRQAARGESQDLDARGAVGAARDPQPHRLDLDLIRQFDAGQARGHPPG